VLVDKNHHYDIIEGRVCFDRRKAIPPASLFRRKTMKNSILWTLALIALIALLFSTPFLVDFVLPAGNPKLETVEDWGTLSKALRPNCPNLSDAFVAEAENWAQKHPDTEASVALMQGLKGALEWCYVSVYWKNEVPPTVLDASRIIIRGPRGQGLRAEEQEGILGEFASLSE